MAGLIGTGADAEGAPKRERDITTTIIDLSVALFSFVRRIACVYYYAPLGFHQSIEPHAAAASCCLYLRSTSPHPAQYLIHSSTTNNHPTTGTAHHVVLWIRQQSAT